MDLIHAALFAILQGATELFPVSSLGHAVIVPALLHWGIDQSAPGFLPFLVMLHVGTAIGLIAYFYVEWISMARGVLGLGHASENVSARALLAKLIVATLPAVIIGAVLKKPIAHLFGSPLMACVFLVFNAGLLWLGERLRARGQRRETGLSYQDALIIGFFQCLAFLPGISRSGAAIVGGLTRGVSHAGAAKFSFLMGTPVILAAAVAELPKLIRQHELHALLGVSLLAAILSGLVAYASTAFLMRYFKDHDEWALNPFALYCAVAGVLAFALLAAGL
ncbi:undecaprenyl-diphosphate phosphatase [Acidocella sp.]|uniref:undecaprenyl-diphosphate phosphatase n=1 Tax=Acidocella sp. TaxID=50710 RepID=UPI002636012C|nr:undecaprenyl-diphosphate phosphatase [Acidocella sp.]